MKQVIDLIVYILKIAKNLQKYLHTYLQHLLLQL